MLELSGPHIPLGVQMKVSVDDRRHDGLAAKVHASGSVGYLHGALRAHLREEAIVHDEDGVVDHGAVAHDEPCALEGDGSGLRCVGSRGTGPQQGDQGENGEPGHSRT